MPPPLERLPGAGDERESSSLRRAWSRLRFGPLILLVALGSFMFWASRQEGGISGTFERFTNYVEGRIDDFTENGDTGAAMEYLNERYAADGVYPDLKAATMQEIDALGVAGLDIKSCSPHHLILETLTARGTVSHLLVAGKDLGRVQGRQACPTDLSDPAPWTVPASDATG